MRTRDTEWLLREKYSGVQSDAYLMDIERLKAGEPLAYVIGWQPFLNTRIYLDSKPLIPRPETEWWVEKICNTYPPDAKLKILDLFAGSGCIGVALLRQFPNATCTFGELKDIHVSTIEKNIRENGIAAERATILTSDIFSQISGTFDLIVANPPYIPLEHQVSALRELSFEPSEALYAPDNGLALIHRFLTEAPQHMHPGSALYMEFNEGQEHDILTHSAALPLSPEVLRDQYGRMRLLVAQYRG